MSIRPLRKTFTLSWLPAVLVCLPALAQAQVPVDSDGQTVGEFEPSGKTYATGNEEIPLLSAAELEELVGPIALYPDDLLAVVLPATAYPLQIVQAGRFIDDLEKNPSLEPDESWDDSVVALTNYPEVIRLLNEDLDWAWRLGEAVVAQQSDVIEAVETFRDRAYAAGNLKSDAHQTVSQNDDHIEITPVSDEVIYVPYYEPEHVVVYQPRPVYYYYPQPYPVYYYPYPAGYAFHRDYFWGVTTAFSLGWHTSRLHVFHHSYYGHPYFGRSYYDRWWYRRPTINVYNNIYVGSNARRSSRHYRSGDYWQPRARRTVRRDDQRITRTRQYPNSRARELGGSASTEGHAGQRTRSTSGERSRRDVARIDRSERTDNSPEIRFRQRPTSTSADRSNDRSNDRSSGRSSDRRAEPARADTRRTEPRMTQNRPREPRETTTRRTEPRVTQNRSSEARQTTTRRTEPRVEQNRPREARQTTTRRTEPRVSQNRSGEARQTTTRRTEPRVEQNRPREARQSTTRRTEPRQAQSRPAHSQRSEPRRSEPRQSGQKQERVARNAPRKERDSKSERRR